MSKEELEFPEHPWVEGQIRPTIEVSIDFLPQRYQGKWHRAVHRFTDNWVRKRKFQQKAAIWMWGCISVNLISRHPDNQVPSWSDFLIQFGMPSRFWDELRMYLDSEFAGQCGGTEMLPATRSEGWVPICHVEQGKVWTLVDADTWSPFVPPTSTKRPRQS
jgi:hypothetical protein